MQAGLGSVVTPYPKLCRLGFPAESVFLFLAVGRFPKSLNSRAGSRTPGTFHRLALTPVVFFRNMSWFCAKRNDEGEWVHISYRSMFVLLVWFTYTDWWFDFFSEHRHAKL